MCPEPCLNRYHILFIISMMTVAIALDDWKREEGGLFLEEKGDHCEIKHVRVCCSVHKWTCEICDCMDELIEIN